ncbi:MAG: MBL fold metallo-hydrolase [Lentisphaerales bacterium]|jgi:metallo-beta-lactamase family protein|nr:MAG: MBL fold metallo-hydrolase [Lentisphaerales bacterium]
MKITFHGAARTTTGSMHLLEINGKRILLECGLYQGRRKVAFEKNRNLPFDPKTIDTVLLSHAHMDHSGNLPSLVKKGFHGRIITTPATADLCEIMLRDSAHIQEMDVKYVNSQRAQQNRKLFEPLYEQKDVEETLRCFVDVPYDKEVEIAPGVKATFRDAGHLLGSATITVDFGGNGDRKRLLFTGDLGRKRMPVLRDPVPVDDVDVLITESTYGDRSHPVRADVVGRLKGLVDDIIMQGSKLIIPSFSVGRTQEIVFFLHELHHEGRIPDVPVFVDSPLSTKATDVYERHPECYDSEAMQVMLDGHEPFQFRSLKYTANVEESKQLNMMPGPAIIISSSGMCEAGRILHHLKNNLENPRNIVLFVGYQAENTLGRRLVERISPVKIFGEEYEVNARIHTINALSAHADRGEMMEYFDSFISKLGKVFVVHGELEKSEALAGLIRDAGVSDVVIPEPDQSFEV